MANISLENLARYDGKIKDYAEDKYLSKNTANWQMTEKAGVVTCYPVSNTELDFIIDFSFTETPPVEGEKGLENPSTITGVNEIVLTKCGKNIFSYPFAETEKTKNGLTITPSLNEGVVTISGTATADTYYNITWTSTSPQLPLGTKCVLSGTPFGGSYDTYYMRASNYANSGKRDEGNGGFITLTDKALGNIGIVVKNGTTLSNVVFKPQLEIGQTLTSFEKGGSTYTHTIPLNSTYYGGFLNTSTGILVVTHGKYVFTGTETGWSNDGNGGLHSYNATTGLGFTTINLNNYTNTVAVEGNSVMNYLPYMGTTESQVINGTRTRACFCYVGNGTQLRLVVPFSSINDLKSWLASKYSTDNPVSITYKLANPIAIQLSSLKIKSLGEFDKNIPRLNTFYTNVNSIQVGYQKHPARTSYELENAILALGGGE